MTKKIFKDDESIRGDDVTSSKNVISDKVESSDKFNGINPMKSEKIECSENNDEENLMESDKIEKSNK